jgi:hypothetical protein
MLFLWPDPVVGRVADMVTILGVPVLTAGTWQLVREFRQERAAQRKIEGVSHGCLEFVDLIDSRRGVAINLVPLDRITVLPRLGDVVFLPGETRESKNLGGGAYEVDDISFVFQEAPDEVDQPCPALPSKVCAHVHRRERK